MFRRASLWCMPAGICWAALVMTAAASAQTIVLPDTVSDAQSADWGWTLSNGHGERTEDASAPGGSALVVSGTGEDANYWRTPDLPLESSSVYVLNYSLKRVGRKAQGTPIAGPVFSNVDHTWVRQEWEPFTDVFMTPAEIQPGRAWMRFGQWHEPEPVAFAGITLTKAVPIHSRFDTITLGRDEVLDGNRYTFRTRWAATMTNHSRTLREHNCHFNTARMVFGKDSYATYCFDAGDRRQQAAECELNLFYRFSGALIVEVSADGNHWTPLGTITEAGKPFTYRVPEQVMPAQSLWLRLRCDADAPLGTESDMGALSVAYIEYRADVDGPPLRAVGNTKYLKSIAAAPKFDVAAVDLGLLQPGRDAVATVELVNNTGKRTRVRGALLLTDGKGKTFASKVRASLKPGANTVRIPYRIDNSGGLDIDLTLAGFHGVLETHVADLYAASYGYLLPAADRSVSVWGTSSGWKVGKHRPVPSIEGPSLSIAAARNETEAAQLIVTPHKPLTNLHVEVSALAGPGGATLSPDAVEILDVAYVFVTNPTDYTSATDYWPDPLPPIEGPLNLPAGENHPFWVRVSIPPDQPAGSYSGAIRLRADGYSAEAPLSVHVYGFTLPARMTCATAFGLGTREVFQYHGVTTPADQRAVLDLYLQNFSKHHISPYDPAPLTPFRVTWPDIKPGADIDPAMLAPTIDWSDWDAAMERGIDQLHFNSFRLGLEGMGGGSYADRQQPSLLGFGEHTPEYRALFANYSRQVEEHLRQKGWLDEAYVYWFDEPDIRDYPFVKEGFQRLERCAPGLRRMLTEQVEPELIGGPNLWCPNSPHFDMASAAPRRAEGDQFWWYLCTGPKAPYATLFIDHAGTELRVFLWQTWQRKIEGVLVWTTTLWTSSTVYPGADNWQNPYEDPMSWTSSGPAGTRDAWGNGDGRFIYPPRAGANGNPERPLITGPVDSVRWEQLRDGIEDYEYFAMLEGLIESKGSKLSPEQHEEYRALLDVPAAVTTDMVTYTIDSAPLYDHRDKVARAIEHLTAL